MATRFVRTFDSYASVGTTRYLSINSTLATEVTLSRGYTGMSLFNQGSTPLVWGDSNIAINSGNYVYPSGRVEWNPVNDGFSIFLISDSTGTLGIAAINEYGT